MNREPLSLLINTAHSEFSPESFLASLHHIHVLGLIRFVTLSMVNWYCCCCFDFLQAACIQSRGWSSRSRTRSSRRSSTRPAVCGSSLARSSSTTTVFVDAVVGVVVVDNHCGSLEMREETENRWNPRDGPCFFFPTCCLVLGAVLSM